MVAKKATESRTNMHIFLHFGSCVLVLYNVSLIWKTHKSVFLFLFLFLFWSLRALRIPPCGGSASWSYSSDSESESGWSAHFTSPFAFRSILIHSAEYFLSAAI